MWWRMEVGCERGAKSHSKTETHRKGRSILPLQISRSALPDVLNLQLSQQAGRYRMTATEPDGKQVEIGDREMNLAIQHVRHWPTMAEADSSCNGKATSVEA